MAAGRRRLLVQKVAIFCLQSVCSHWRRY